MGQLTAYPLWRTRLLDSARIDGAIERTKLAPDALIAPSERLARTTDEGSSSLPAEGTGAAERTRTSDPIITNDVLYQLSYSGPGRRSYPAQRASSNPADNNAQVQNSAPHIPAFMPWRGLAA